ncbi:MAG: glycerol kinase GlpK [Gemmataceae bacterium]
MPHLLSLDAGTSSTRAIVFDDAGLVRAVAQKELPQHYPMPGWVEHDPNDIWTMQLGVAIEAIGRAGLRPSDIAAIGIANQRENNHRMRDQRDGPFTARSFGRITEPPDHCDRLRREGYEDFIGDRTGLVLDAYFSATKIAWLLSHVPNARIQAERGELAFGTVETWLAWNLSGGRSHVTDPTNASRTLLFNLHKQLWDDELLKLFDIPRSMLPEIRPSSGIAALTAPGFFGDREIPIAGLAGDQQAALFGHRCLAPGQTKTTYGTGCFLLQNTGKTPIASKHRLLTTIAYHTGDHLAYALEGSVFVAGAVVQWLRDGLGIIERSEEVGTLAASVPDSGDVILVPAFVGLGAPHWDSTARGLLIGLTRGTHRGHIARAALESIAFQVADLIEAMQIDSGLPIREMLADGGAVKNDLLMQIQADLLGIPIVRPAQSETTALGAALLAGLGVGVWRGISNLPPVQASNRRFDPQSNATSISERRLLWREAVRRTHGWTS